MEVDGIAKSEASNLDIGVRYFFIGRLQRNTFKIYFESENEAFFEHLKLRSVFIPFPLYLPLFFYRM